MAKFTAQKAYSDDPGSFNKTEKWELLMCSNVEGNNNKFYCIEIQHDETADQYRIFSHYGRLAGDVVTGVYDVRGPGSLTDIEDEYNSIIKDKERGKTKKHDDGTKYTEKYVKVNVVQPTVGSTNIRKKAGTAAVGFSKAGHTTMFKQYDPVVSTVLSRLFAENVHNITTATGGVFKMTASGLQTPLGPLTLDHINKAVEALDQLKPLIPDDGTRANFSDKKFRELNTLTFSLIPRPFSHGKKITDEDLIFDMKKLLAEYDLLDQMKSTVQITDEEEDHKPLDFQMELADTDTTKTLIHYVESTRKHSQLKTWKPTRVFTVLNQKERDRFIKTVDVLSNIPNPKDHGKVKDGEIYDFFHGSKNSNILSLLLNGFVVPPANAPHVTGRMYGNHLYFANASTKSLNYSIGNWSKSGLSFNGSTKNSVFLIITKVAMGKIYKAERSLTSGIPAGYNSIYAPNGYDTVNDEFIATVPQTTITHLIELENIGY